MSNSEIPSSPDERSGDLSEIFKLGREGAVAAVQDLTGQTQTLESLDNLHADLMHHASLLADDWAKKYKSPCKAGCSFCCYMRVTANPVELLIIANNVQRTLSADRLNELRERLRKNVKKISPFSLREHAESKTPCAFLLPSGSCSIYEARPLNCRRWVSLSVDACEKNFLLPSETENIPLEGRTHAWVAGRTKRCIEDDGPRPSGV
jgi:hypothetical protein